MWYVKPGSSVFRQPFDRKDRPPLEIRTVPNVLRML